MSTAAIQYAANVLGIKQTLYDMSAPDRERVKNYMRAHNDLVMRDDVFLHNSAPFIEGMRAWSPMSRLVFRGSGAPYAALGSGFSAVPNERFDKPVIIRDEWRAKHVMTHMQTKAVLAWSKSFYVAVEYAYGCIKGNLEQGVIPGYIHFCWVDMGLDVVQAVREWEGNNPGVFLQEIDPGQQFEIITPTVPQNRILASWELRKAPGGAFGQFVITDKTIHPGHFAAVMNDYNAISNALPNVNHTYDYPERGNYVDQQVLFLR
ncbi:MAG: hypothetical protein ABW208_25355 [Pyrinomonadaceae bacterium]